MNECFKIELIEFYTFKQIIRWYLIWQITEGDFCLLLSKCPTSFLNQSKYLGACILRNLVKCFSIMKTRIKKKLLTIQLLCNTSIIKKLSMGYR